MFLEYQNIFHLGWATTLANIFLLKNLIHLVLVEKKNIKMTNHIFILFFYKTLN